MTNQIFYLSVFALFALALGGVIDIHFMLEFDVNFELPSIPVNVDFPVEIPIVFSSLSKESKKGSSR